MKSINLLDLPSIEKYTMEIRKARIRDIQAIVDFQQRMAHESEGIVLDNEVLTQGVQRVFEDHSKGFYLIAEDNGQAVASMLLTPEWSDWRNRLYLWIQSLYVLPEFRKKGVFGKLYEHVRGLVNSSDEYAGLKLYVAEKNQSAQEVYLRVGMKRSHYQLFEWNKFKY